MTDHGLLDDHQAAQAVGDMVLRAIDQLNFAGAVVDGLVARTGVEIDGAFYEISVEVKAP